jgi:hypothetical protein
MAMVVWLLELQLPMQSVPITTDVVRSNLYQGERYKTKQRRMRWLRHVLRMALNRIIKVALH